MKWASILWLAVLLALSGCGLIYGDTSTYRFRMTVEVVTPEGLKTGSSVYEVSAGNVKKILPDAQSRSVSVRGEAVAVDVAPGQTLFALLRTNAHFESMVGLSMETLDPHFTDRYDVVATAARLAERDETGPPAVVDPENYPMLVTFTDIADPTSVAKVDPADLAASFGEGVKLRRITAELTDDPVTTGIEKRLGWLGKVKSMNLTADQFPEGLPLGDFSGLFKKDGK